MYVTLMSIKCTAARIRTQLVCGRSIHIHTCMLFFRCFAVVVAVYIIFFLLNDSNPSCISMGANVRSRTKKMKIDLKSDYFPHMQLTADFEHTKKSTQKGPCIRCICCVHFIIALLLRGIVKISIKNLCVFIYTVK